MRGASIRPARVRQGETTVRCCVLLTILGLLEIAPINHPGGNHVCSTPAVQVEKQCAKFFTMHVDQDTIDKGFIIAAHSPALSKFKLLLFEQAPDGHQWELVRQVRAMLNSQLVHMRRSGAHLHLEDTYLRRSRPQAQQMHRRTARGCARSRQLRSSSCSCRQ